MTCREDESCIHIGHDAHNMSILRCQATLGSGLAAKRKQAGWDNEYLGAYIPTHGPVAMEGDCPVRCTLPRVIGYWPPALDHWSPPPVRDPKYGVSSGPLKPQ